jgi:hypothetical protein
MTLRRAQRTGLMSFVARWIRRIRRLLMVLSITAAVYRWWQSRQAGPWGGGGGGSGRPVPTGGPAVPSAARPLPAASPEPELVGVAPVPHAHVGPTQESSAPTEASDGDAWAATPG